VDYRQFIDQGAATWAEAEALYGRASRQGTAGLDMEGVERLAGTHRRVVSDFATARSRFPGTEAEQRLRALAFSGHRLLAPRPPPALPRLWQFLRFGWPEQFQQSLGALSVSLAIFVLSTVLGIVLATLNPEFCRIWLAPEALDEVRRGGIWTDQLVHLAPPSLLSTQIFTNNMSVAITTWLAGALLGLGTVYLLSSNGLMLGSMLALTWRYELTDRLLAFISGHGPLELFLIVVAGAAGLQLAAGELRWRNRPRAETLPVAARRSAALMAGTLPWFILLGLVEGNISPQMWIPTPAKALLGLVLLGTFLAYGLGIRRPPGETA